MQTLDGHEFKWSTKHNFSRVITVSHGFMDDGPNMAFGELFKTNQPWGSKDGKGQELSDDAKAFGKSVGNSLNNGGKILLLGCSMGAGAYAGNVAKATGRHVFAATASISAGDPKSTLKLVKSIEHGHAKTPMQDFKP